MVKEEILKIIREQCVEHGIDILPDDVENLNDYGINSVLFISIIVKLEKRFNVEIDDENLDYSKFKTVEDLCKLVEK